MFETVRYVPNSFSITFPRRHDIRRTANDFEDFLQTHPEGYDRILDDVNPLFSGLTTRARLVANTDDGAIVEDHTRRCTDARTQAQAMLRAFLTVVIELMRVADDSFGCIGDSFHDGFAQYLALPLEETGIEETVFFHDLLTLLIWEDYGLTYDRTEGYFERLTPEQGDLCIDYVQQQMAELKDDDLDYQYEKALTLLGQVVAEQNRFERFEELARQMGTRHWKRIVVLVDRAIKKRKRKLAATVFEAALSPGMHEGFLRKKYEQLKRGKWNPDPRS
jgi:hypothetical protein